MPKKIAHQLDVATSFAVSSIRFWRGTNKIEHHKAPDKTLVLYDYEGCPSCRLVREALTNLYIDVDIRPCPKGGVRFRTKLDDITGAQRIPTLVDPNTDQVLSEPQHIIDYLFDHYAESTPMVRSKLLQPIAVASSMLASSIRSTRGVYVRPSIKPKLPLELYSFESSPYSRLVRETLSELEIPYRLHNAGKEQWVDMGPATLHEYFSKYQPVTGSKREALKARTGRIAFPYLYDPNTKQGMYESATILEYLEAQYTDKA